MSGRQLAGSWLIGLGVGSMTLAAVRSEVASVAFPILVGAAGFLLLRYSGRTRPRFPNTDLERGLDRLFALLLPTRKATTTAASRIAIARLISVSLCASAAAMLASFLMRSMSGIPMFLMYSF